MNELEPDTLKQQELDKLMRELESGNLEHKESFEKLATELIRESETKLEYAQKNLVPDSQT